MNITISDKTPSYTKLVRLGNTFNINPALIAAGILHSALNSEQDAEDAFTTAPAPAEPPVIESPEPPTLPKWKAPAQEPEFDINSVTFTECIPTLPQ